MTKNTQDKNQVNDRVFAADKCTAIIVGGGGSASGSPMTTHTADCAECDWRINKVEAQDWPEGAMRPIFLITGAYPRQVREDRGLTWSKANLEDMPQKAEWEAQEGKYVIGYIPQVRHTYALIEGMYGIMNEHQVAIGESTCAARLYAAPVFAGGKALLEVSELSQLGLERGRTAREAIQVMGDLAMKYGYYSAEWDTNKYGEAYAMGEGGEALTVVDPNEAWVFHIMPDDTGSQAVWVAQRVPDNHITAVGNSFIIKEVIPNHPDFMYSSNLWEVAERKGWWKQSDGLLHFLKVYAPQRYHPNYSNMRLWRVLSLGAPDLNLPAETNAYADDYPFSVPVTRPQGKFSAQDLMWMQRDHFEGTPYSTAEGLAAGPYGDPNRFDLWTVGNMTIWQANEGEFPRTISLFRTSYSFVAEPRKNVPSVFARMWFCLYAPDTSTYTPIYIQAKELSKAWITGTMQKYDNTKAWWNFCVVGNYAARFYSFAMKGVRKLQARLDQQLAEIVDSTEKKLIASFYSSDSTKQTNEIVNSLTEVTKSTGDLVSNAWRDYFPELLTTYRDGYVIGGQHNATVEIHRMFYPKWWLDKVGFFNIPGNKNGILFQPNPIAINNNNNSSWGEASLLTFTAVLCFLLGMWVSNKLNGKGSKVTKTWSFGGSSTSREYSPIPDSDIQMSAMGSPEKYQYRTYNSSEDA